MPSSLPWTSTVASYLVTLLPPLAHLPRSLLHSDPLKTWKHVISFLKILQWFPIIFRIKTKVLILVCQALTATAVVICLLSFPRPLHSSNLAHLLFFCRLSSLLPLGLGTCSSFWVECSSPKWHALSLHLGLPWSTHLISALPIILYSLHFFSAYYYLISIFFVSHTRMW